MPQYSPSVALSSLNGATGFRIVGANAHDRMGAAFAFGDVNGDGYEDILVGVPNGNDPGGDDPGASYVIFGAADGWFATFDLAALDGNNGFSLIGITHLDSAGESISLGDINGDGLADLIIGAWNANPSGNTGSGDTYVVFGAESGWEGTIDLAALNGTDGFRIVGVDGDDNSGESVSYAGDVNGDGYGDIIIGASQAESVADTAYDNGHSYLVFGSASGWPASIALASLNGTNGFRIDGFYQDQWSGSTVAGGGDINGDGYDDLLIGSIQGGIGFSGETYVVFGAPSGWTASISLDDLDGTNGFLIAGLSGGDFSSRSLAIAGDVNGDGYDDFLIGGGGAADPAGRFNAGRTYLVFGAASGWTASFDLATLEGTNGFSIIGASSGDGAANAAAAGDFNGDGFADLIVGAPGGESSGDLNYGETYVIFGAASGFGAVFDLATINGDNGMRFDGIDLNDGSGAAAAGGDINGDGIDDIVIGAPDAFTSGGVVFTGEAYVVFGGRPGEAVNRTGTALDNRIFGGAFNDTLSGLAGNDTLDGGAGLDTSVYSIASTAATWTRNPNGTWTVTGDGTDTLISVEYLDFTDRDVFLDRAQSNFSTDGVSDFFLRNTATGSMVMWFNANSANAAGLGTLSNDWVGQGFGDFNGDGRDDILWRNTSNGNMSMWFMNNQAVVGSGGFGVGLSWSISGIGDINGDLRDDIVWRNSNGDLILWFMDGLAISGAGLGNVSTDWQIEVLGDFNGDGRDDFIWRNTTNGNMSMWLMNGTSAAPDSFANVGGAWDIAGVGDLNGDGRDDVMWRNGTTGDVSLWFMNAGTITSASGFGISTTYQVADLGDYNGDGRDDIIWRNVATGDIIAWYMNGAAVTGSAFLGGLGSDWIINPGG